VVNFKPNPILFVLLFIAVSSGVIQRNKSASDATKPFSSNKKMV
jgi:hypothetical protein